MGAAETREARANEPKTGASLLYIMVMILVLVYAIVNVSLTNKETRKDQQKS